MTPGFEGFIDGEQFLVVSVVTKLGTTGSAAIKGDRVNTTIPRARRKDSSDGVVGGVRFYDWRQGWIEMMQDRSSSRDCSLQECKLFLTSIRPISKHILARKTRKGNRHVGLNRW